MLYNIPPTYLHLKVFGSLCFTFTIENKRTKLDPISRKCIFLGYKNDVKGYALLDIGNKKLIMNKNIFSMNICFLTNIPKTFKNIKMIIFKLILFSFLLEPLKHINNINNQLQTKNTRISKINDLRCSTIKDFEQVNNKNDQVQAENSIFSDNNVVRCFIKVKRALWFLIDYHHKSKNFASFGSCSSQGEISFPIYHMCYLMILYLISIFVTLWPYLPT